MIGRHDEIREALEAYALGALDAIERARVERHLRDCRECRRALSEYSGVADSFPRALRAGSASRLDPETKARVLRRIAGRRRIALPLAAGLAAALILAVLLGWNLQLGRALDQERQAFASLASYQEIVFEVVDSPRVRKVMLTPPVSGSTSYGKMYVRPDLPFVVAMVGRLPDAPAGHAYHLWLTLDSGESILAGTLQPKPNTQGFDAIVYDAGRNGPALASAKVILQPSGSTRPEGAPALVWAP